MAQWVRKWFLDHPRQLGLTYAAHARGSLGLAATFGTLMVQATIHATIPGLFVHSSSHGIKVDLPQRLAALPPRSPKDRSPEEPR